MARPGGVPSCRVQGRSPRQCSGRFEGVRVVRGDSGTGSGWCLVIVVSFSMGWAGPLGGHRLPEAGQTRRARKRRFERGSLQSLIRLAEDFRRASAEPFSCGSVASVDDRCPGTEDEVRKDGCLDAPRLPQHPWIWSEIGRQLTAAATALDSRAVRYATLPLSDRTPVPRACALRV